MDEFIKNAVELDNHIKEISNILVKMNNIKKSQIEICWMEDEPHYSDYIKTYCGYINDLSIGIHIHYKSDEDCTLFYHIPTSYKCCYEYGTLEHCKQYANNLINKIK